MQSIHPFYHVLPESLFSFLIFFAVFMEKVQASLQDPFANFQVQILYLLDEVEIHGREELDRIDQFII
jgi:hypothetical protein